MQCSVNFVLLNVRFFYKIGNDDDDDSSLGTPDESVDRDDEDNDDDGENGADADDVDTKKPDRKKQRRATNDQGTKTKKSIFNFI